MTTEPHRDPESDSARRWARFGDATVVEAVVNKLVPGHLLVRLGRFEAIARIGSGGHGIVFRGRDPDLDRLVALKLCLAGNERAARRLMGEAKVLAKLNHPNIVTVYELGWHGKDVFIAMQYVDGSNASAFARRDPSVEAVIDVFRGVGRGLAAAHDLGIVHGDVKPSNILLDRDDFPRIADFGLAKLHEPERVADPRKHVPSGTWVFMAPEVLRGQPSNALSDQWSFCVSLLEVLTNEPVFDGSSPRRVLRQIERGRVEAKLERVPVAAREVLRVGLSLDPRDRHPSMRALVDELEKLRVPAGVVELTPSAAPTTKPKRGTFAVALMIGLTGATIGWVGRGQVAAPLVSEPTPLPAPSPCAVDVSGATTNDVLVLTCSRIRAGKLREAARLWDAEFTARQLTEEKLELLRAETLTVARTAVDQAERIHRWAWLTRSIGWVPVMFRRPVADDPATLAWKFANRYVARAESLDPDDPDLQPIRERLEELRGLLH